MSGHPYYSSLIRLGCTLSLAALLGSCDGGGRTVSSGSGADSPDSAAPLDIAQALGSDASLTLTVELSGSMVLPVVATRDSARVDLVFDRTAKRMFAVLQSSVEQPLDVHIHEGDVGEVGAEVATLFADGTTYTLGEGMLLTARQAELLEAGKLYIDVHTADYPDGLLRAQLTAAAIETAVYPLLEDIQAKVLTPVCSGCHNGSGQTLPGVMNFTSIDRSYESLVGVHSTSEPTLLRVDPASPQESLLMRKIEGTHDVGSRMPLRGSRLNEQTIAAIRGWIADGAPR